MVDDEETFVDWKSPYIVIRAQADGPAQVVHQADKIKDARYWLQYIALPGDALFQTPAHPKSNGSEGLEYKAHLIARGNVGYNEEAWKKLVQESGKAAELPCP